MSRIILAMSFLLTVPLVGLPNDEELTDFLRGGSRPFIMDVAPEVAETESEDQGMTSSEGKEVPVSDELTPTDSIDDAVGVDGSANGNGFQVTPVASDSTGEEIVVPAASAEEAMEVTPVAAEPAEEEIVVPAASAEEAVDESPPLVKEDPAPSLDPSLDLETLMRFEDSLSEEPAETEATEESTAVTTEEPATPEESSSESKGWTWDDSCWWEQCCEDASCCENGGAGPGNGEDGAGENGESEDSDVVTFEWLDHIIRRHALELKKATRLHWIGAKGINEREVDHLVLAYESYHPLTVEQARKMLVYATESLLNVLNKGEWGHPQLAHNPFGPEHLTILIKFDTFFGKYVDRQYVERLVLRKGIVNYKAFHCKGMKRHCERRKERYQDSVDFVKLELEMEERDRDIQTQRDLGVRIDKTIPFDRIFKKPSSE